HADHFLPLSQAYRNPQDLHSFPTRRSSDLEGLAFSGVGLGALRFHMAVAGGQLRLQDITSDLPTGKITGRAEVPLTAQAAGGAKDRKSTRLNSSHRTISYAVFCLKKKKKNI